MEPASIVGTWKLDQWIQHGNNKTEWEPAPPEMIYEKYITDTHFTWINYDPEQDQLTGIGGGTYTFDGDTYIENIEFFHPPSSSLAGQQIAFTAEFKDGKWYHTGYGKNMEFDPETAETVVVDSTKIEETWIKFEGEVVDTSLQGTWELLTQRSDPDGPEISYPDFVKYLKHITPTHFVWIQYNSDGDEISGAGSGTYQFDGKRYVENVQMAHPTGSNITDAQITFDCVLEGNRWIHYSTTESIYVDEKWIRVDK